ncbi:MAG TPA: tRNA epoxyqueuosine(34) reductase QueG [Candidatus Xenobia bacterium]|nr:tRNA epoxyqueuosine(34) reductase QueG [Candidatus Xenobia bacterium]
MLTTARVIELGRAVGFTKIGVAPATDLPELRRFPEWLARGYTGEMNYLRNPKRRDVRELMPEARSVICCALAYDTPHPRSTETPPDPERGWISRYAWGDDYHTIIEEKLEALRGRLAEEAGDYFGCKLYVDTGPVLERVYGKHAGLGWQAKNTCLLDAELGSFFFLGVLVTNLALEPTTPQADGCGSCTLCIEACPTGAIVEPCVLDARRCLSYLTIELRGPIPEEFRPALGRHVFGCDICQDVCPYNRKSLVSDLALFHPRRLLAAAPPAETKLENRKSKLGASSDTAHRPPGTEALFHPRLGWLASLTEDDFKEVFQSSPVRRAKWRGLLRNVLVALGNSRNSRFRSLVEKFAASSDSLLAEHARWALAQLD